MRKILVVFTGALVGLSACTPSASYQRKPVSFYKQVKVAPPSRAMRIQPASARRPAAPRRAATPRINRTSAVRTKNGRLSSRWTTIVIHHSGTDRGSAAVFDRAHRKKGWDSLGYHFVIGNGTDSPDGLVEAGPRWYEQKHGAHCKTPDNYYNDHGIGICLVGDFTSSRPTRRQLASLDRLVRQLSDACRIPAWALTTHEAVTGKTACPGPYIPLAALRRSVESQRTAPAGQE